MVNSPSNLNRSNLASTDLLIIQPSHIYPLHQRPRFCLRPVPVYPPKLPPRAQHDSPCRTVINSWMEIEFPMCIIDLPQRATFSVRRAAAGRVRLCSDLTGVACRRRTPWKMVGFGPIEAPLDSHRWWLSQLIITQFFLSLLIIFIDFPWCVSYVEIHVLTTVGLCRLRPVFQTMSVSAQKLDI